jgi:hypothetical protein
MRALGPLLLASVLTGGVPARAAEKEPAMPALSARRQQEYDALGYDPKKVFAAFTRLKRAYARKDFEAFARLVTYPVTIERKAGPVTIKDAAELTQHREALFSPRMAAAIKVQSFQSLTLKDEGAMVGRQFLISGACTDGGDRPCEYGITSISLP